MMSNLLTNPAIRVGMDAQYPTPTRGWIACYVEAIYAQVGGPSIGATIALVSVYQEDGTGGRTEYVPTTILRPA